MLLNQSVFQCYDPPRNNFNMILHSDASVLPALDEFSVSNFNPSTWRPTDQDSYGFEMNCEDGVYPAGNRQQARSLQFLYDEVSQTSDWKSKQVFAWNEVDVRNWILEIAKEYNFDLTEIPLFAFNKVNGPALLKMSKQDFYEKMYSPTNGEESTLIAERLHDALHHMSSDLHNEQEVPVTVMNISFNDHDNFPSRDDCGKDLLNLDNYHRENLENQTELSSIHQNSYIGNQYDSMSEDNEIRPFGDCLGFEDNSTGATEQTASLVIAKRPPGRPKGSGKKHPKRVKNVSVPEFLRDLLLDPKYCPRIIKWEDHAAGKFRFVRADEVAKIWGGKRNNEKMSFEKFSRAMRYHYKQQVLVSVPTARLVYQFGPKGPQF